MRNFFDWIWHGFKRHPLLSIGAGLSLVLLAVTAAAPLVIAGTLTVGAVEMVGGIAGHFADVQDAHRVTDRANADVEEAKAKGLGADEQRLQQDSWDSQTSIYQGDIEKALARDEAQLHADEARLSAGERPPASSAGIAKTLGSRLR